MDDKGVGIVSGFVILIVMVVGIMGFLMLTNEFDIHYFGVIKDPTNSTGILAGNNSSSYVAVKTTSDTITANLPVGILLAFLLAVIVFILLVWAMLKK